MKKDRKKKRFLFKHPIWCTRYHSIEVIKISINMISFTYNLVVLRRATLASISLLILCIVGFFPLDLASHIIFHTIKRNRTTGSSKLVSASNFRRSAPSAVISGMSVLTTSKHLIPISSFPGHRIKECFRSSI